MRKPIMNVMVHKWYTRGFYGIQEIQLVRRIAAKYRFVLRFHESAENLQPSGSLSEARFAVVLGVDEHWLRETIEGLCEKGIMPVLINGYNSFGQEISWIRVSQNAIIQDSLSYLQKKKKVNTALFGVQQNDTSDLQKWNAFQKYQKGMGVCYFYRGSGRECFDKFFQELDHFDSVISVNDIMTVYLLSECRRRQVNLAEKMTIISNGLCPVSCFVTIPFLTYLYETAEQEQIIGKALRFLYSNNGIDSLQVSCNINCVNRVWNTELRRIGEWGNCTKKQAEYIYSEEKLLADDYKNDEALREIQRINEALRLCDATDIKILASQLSEYRYSDMAEQLFLSEGALKSRIRKLYKGFGVSNRNELKNLLEQYSIRISP